MNGTLPAWADQMRDVFRAGTTSQFILHGNVVDLFPVSRENVLVYVSLREFVTEVLFAPFDVVLFYDRGKGIRLTKGSDYVFSFLKLMRSYGADVFMQSSRTRTLEPSPNDPGFLPRDPLPALEFIDRFLRASQGSSKVLISERGERLRVAVVIDYAEFVIPRAEPLYLANDMTQVLLKIMDWARDPMITNSYAATCLISDNINDLNPQIVESPYVAKIKIPLPTSSELLDFLNAPGLQFLKTPEFSALNPEVLASKLVGISRVNAHNLLAIAVRNNQAITDRYLTEQKKSFIEKEAFGRLEFVESAYTLDNVAGHTEAKAWLRRDVTLLQQGRVEALPMGYLITGRIGTGKTFLVECFAGEIGIPVVELKNFREKWVGATEGNLEKIFTILHALGQVIVFVDEADQATGKRGGGEGDSGLSGRIYSMLAREMSDTRNRGKIIWIFATSRPDLLEVDLKRQGRLDVHIPLFPPQDAENRKLLFLALAKKLKINLNPDHLPALATELELGGNEIEGVLIRAVRLFYTQTTEPPASLAEILQKVLSDFRPSAHAERLELMDLLAVKECTDAEFLIPKYRALSVEQVNQRIYQLQLTLGERFL